MRHKDQWILIEGPFEPASDANSDEITVFCPDFYDLGSSKPLRGAKTYRLTTEDMRHHCEAYLAQHPSSEVPVMKASWEEPQKEDFAQALTVIQNRIRKNEIQKAVPVVFSRSAQTVSATERAQIISNLLKAPPTLYVYGLWQNGKGVLGATPETLFDYSQGILKTMALAGTCPKSEASERDSLLNDAKEMQEHLLVLQDIKEVLSPWGEVKTHGPYIVELPTLYHLKTDIQIHCHKKPEFLSLVKDLHPTPALGVAPRSQGYKWMAELPGQDDRGPYGGPFAVFAGEEALCLVGIRNLQWNKNLAMIGSGCGIVADSELEREWREVFQKRQSVRKILGLEL